MYFSIYRNIPVINTQHQRKTPLTPLNDNDDNKFNKFTLKFNLF